MNAPQTTQHDPRRHTPTTGAPAPRRTATTTRTSGARTLSPMTPDARDDTRDREHPAAPHPDETRAPTAVRHLRFPVDAWRRAAARARAEGYGVAEIAAALVTAYADGRIDHPDHPPTTSSAGAPPRPDAYPDPDDGTVRRPGRRPNGSGKEPNRSFRIADEKWAAGVESAHKLGVTLASRLVQAVDDVIEEARGR